MSKEISLALLGLIPNDENKIKMLLSKVIPHQISWKSATSIPLDGVIINVRFMNTPQIRKYMNSVNANVVFCGHVPDEELENDQSFAYLNLGRISEVTLRPWLTALLAEGERSNPAVRTQQGAPAPTVRPVAVKHASDSSEQEVSLRTAGTQLRMLFSPDETTISYDTLSELIDIIERHNHHLLAVLGDSFSWLDTEKGEVSFTYSRDEIQAIENYTWYSADKLTPPDNLRKTQLELWFFAVVWQSKMNFINRVNEDAYYKLNRWPQPITKRGRNEALRLAAAIQLDALSIEQIMERTSYSRSLVCKFLFATNLLGYTSILAAPEPKNPLTYGAVSERKTDEATQSIIQRLRAKLGI